MNVFCSNPDPVLSAKVLADRHVVKMCVETAQILSTALRARGQNHDGLYRPAYVKHPCCLIAAENDAYFQYALQHGLALCAEYTRRYSRTHAAEQVLTLISSVWPHADYLDLKIPLAMPDEYKSDDPYESYRVYLLAKYDNWRKLLRPPTWKLPVPNNYLEVM